LIMKSRVMGDYQARFCERFGSEILPYLLDRMPHVIFLLFWKLLCPPTQNWAHLLAGFGCALECEARQCVRGL